jgi:ribosomal protein S18 acetylase RimI-like enzyme
VGRARSAADDPVIRPVRPDELARLQDIERAAGATFVDVGMPEIAADEPPSVAALESHRAAGRAWAVESSGVVAGYVLVDVVDGAAHVEQVSVDPAFARRGLGRRLIDHVAAVAEAKGRPAVTLTTFRDVPWNAPYYRRCGFRDLAESELGPELRRLRDAEAAHGLDPTLRVCMRRDLAPPSPPGAGPIGDPS